MISCGEPSGDLYAGALAVEIRRRQPDAAIFGLGGQRLMAGRRRTARRLPRPQRHGARRGGPRASEIAADPQPPGGGRPLREAGRPRPDRFSRLQFSSRGGDQEARRAHHLLHQPSALGVAQEPHEGDEAARRPRAGDFSVRGTDLSGCRRARAVRRPSARRSRARAGAEGELSRRDRPRSGAADRRAAARQPSERSRASAAGHPRRSREDRRAAAARRSSSSRGRRHSTIGCFRARSGAAFGLSKCSREPTMFSRFRMWRLRLRARPPCRLHCMAARWWSCTACRR